MIRKIIEINESKCNGCGACAKACHEGAIGMINGKAKLLREDYCDGLGDCLPTCPTGAISFIERDAAAYDQAAVMQNKQQLSATDAPFFQRCPGAQARSLSHQTAIHSQPTLARPSLLQQWPVQIQLVPIQAPYFQNAKLLIAADCTAYAYAAFHEKFIRGHVTLIGCPKLDSVQYAQKLTEIIQKNEIQSVSVVRMEVPCCGGLEQAVRTALQQSGKFLPWQVVTISMGGLILE